GGFNGIIDEIRAYNRTLNGGEIAEIANIRLRLNFDETSGEEIYDFSGYGTNCSKGSASRIEGKYLNGLSFNGSEQLALEENANLKLGQSLTVSAWVKTSDIPETFVTIITKQSENIRNYGLFVSGAAQGADEGKIVFSMTSGTQNDWKSATSAISIVDGQWHQITGTYNGSQMKIFIDGLEQGSADVSVIPADTSNGVLIGTGYKGIIDEIRIYDLAIQPSEILFKTDYFYEEQCDDGNNSNNDGCSAVCFLENL
ncbi:MAG TPA: LamG-like jellyroll fold domain-containing protein, partial [bacterium]|nr:LamG-like jellyroll fold domain-containing protein [bacterium]